MSTTTQFNPNVDLNKALLAIGASKTVYALVTPETEKAKAIAFGNDGDGDRAEFFGQFREAWTGKQDALHENFFSTWCDWSKPVVDFDRSNFPFYYPTAGASEPLRQIIFNFAAHGGKTIHVFEGEYEGYKAMAEAAGLSCKEWPRDKWREHGPVGSVIGWNGFHYNGTDDLFFISQPSAIDGNVWIDFNQFVSEMPRNSIVADVTYVGAVPEKAIIQRFNLNARSIRNVVFSLSKPFGCYYDRIGGVFCREQDLGLFGNKWFKSLSALRIGTILMQRHDVFDFPSRNSAYQGIMAGRVGRKLAIDLVPSDVYILAMSSNSRDEQTLNYLRRAGKIRVCLTPGMAKMIGTAS